MAKLQLIRKMEVRESSTKRRKFTADDMREAIDQKLSGHRSINQIPNELWYKIWLESIDEAKWGFQEVMEYISKFPTVVGVAHLSVVLASNNNLWQRWFFKDFPDFVRDLKLKPNQIPYPWMAASFEHARANPHPDDYLFEQVPWRSYYMWTYMFRRQCAKLIVHHMKYRQFRMGELPEEWNDVNIEEYRDIYEENGETQVRIHLYEDPEEFEYPLEEQLLDVIEYIDVHLQEVPLTIVSRATPYVAWYIYLKNMHDLLDPEDETAQETTVAEAPRLDRDPQYYNFPVGDVLEAFIRWYVYELRDRIMESFGPEEVNLPTLHPLIDLTETRDEDNLVARAHMLGLVDASGTKWFPLQKLPLCPRRPRHFWTQHDVQFLGQRAY